MARVIVVDPEELRELIQDAVNSAMAGRSQPSEWIDARSAPMGAKAFQRLAREGALPAVKLGKKWQARRSDVDAYMDRQRTERPHVAPSNDVPDPVLAALDAGRLRVIKADRRPG
jgi:excisionase family DNA binding protein